MNVQMRHMMEAASKTISITLYPSSEYSPAAAAGYRSRIQPIPG